MTGPALDVNAFTRTIHELLVLASLRAAPKHGYEIVLDLDRQSGGAVVLQYGTLYPLLHRLERDALVAGAWEEDGGRRRKVYTLTAAGAERLRAGAADCDALFALLRSMLGRGRRARAGGDGAVGAA